MANQLPAPKAKRTGVRRFERPDRPSPFLVQWREDGSVKTESYAEVKDRDRRADEIERQRKSGKLETANRAEIQEYRAILRGCDGVPWQDILAGYRAWLQMTGLGVCSKTVAQYAKEYLGALPATFSSQTLRQKRHKVGHLVTAFGDLRLDYVTAPEIEGLSERLGYTHPATFDNYRKIIRAFFADAVRKRLLRFNPCDQIKPRGEGIHHVGILSVHDTARLFHTALATPEYRDAIPRLALEAFAGLRFGSACRIEEGDINFEDRGILLPAHKIKTKRRYFVTGLPDNLWEWLALKVPAAWSLTPRTYMELKNGLFRKAEVPHPHNCLRHGFASYHVGEFQDPGRTALILCHRNQQKLWDHYLGIATRLASRWYWRIRPETAGHMAQDGWQPSADEAPPAG